MKRVRFALRRLLGLRIAVVLEACPAGIAHCTYCPPPLESHWLAPLSRGGR